MLLGLQLKAQTFDSTIVKYWDSVNQHKPLPDKSVIDATQSVIEINNLQIPMPYAFTNWEQASAYANDSEQAFITDSTIEIQFNNTIFILHYKGIIESIENKTFSPSNKLYLWRKND